MSKKDYEAIARALYGTLALRENAAQQWTADVSAIAAVLAADNGRFDRERFIEACETGTTRGMRKAAAAAVDYAALRRASTGRRAGTECARCGSTLCALHYDVCPGDGGQA